MLLISCIYASVHFNTNEIEVVFDTKYNKTGMFLLLTIDTVSTVHIVWFDSN